ncbi:MAG TPA: thrombospondin type 3 repeat-containing protein [Candidatus Polarisedimenticolaceae bacterium]
MTLRATGLGSQATPDARVQYVRWEVDRLVGAISEPAIEHPFVTSSPCIVAASPVTDGDVRRCSGGSGLTLTAGTPRTLTLQVQIGRLDGIAAQRPDLPDGGDYDGDGVPNGSDNCKLLSNPPVAGDDGVLAQPKDCYILDVNGERTLPDQDGDKLADSSDNCLWFPNGSDQTDANLNGIGDACERTLPASLPTGGFAIRCPGEFTVAESGLSLFIVDFTQALTCDLVGGTCNLALPAVGQSTAITIRRADQDASDAVDCTRIDLP